MWKYLIKNIVDKVTSVLSYVTQHPHRSSVQDKNQTSCNCEDKDQICFREGTKINFPYKYRA